MSLKFVTSLRLQLWAWPLGALKIITQLKTTESCLNKLPMESFFFSLSEKLKSKTSPTHARTIGNLTVKFLCEYDIMEMEQGRDSMRLDPEGGGEKAENNYRGDVGTRNCISACACYEEKMGRDMKKAIDCC